MCNINQIMQAITKKQTKSYDVAENRNHII